MRADLLKITVLMLLVALVSGCATPVSQFDYTAFKQSHPASILVLPPVNNSVDVGATNSILSLVTYPLAESGYYVFPVTLVNETFKQNGLTNASDIQGVEPGKLHDIFGADAGLYLTVTRYGSEYHVLSSAAVVSVNAKLVDLKTGSVLWAGVASATDNGGNNNSGGLAGMLVSALVTQIMNNITDRSYAVAGRASNFLLMAGRQNGLLYGPRSPKYELQLSSAQ